MDKVPVEQAPVSQPIAPQSVQPKRTHPLLMMVIIILMLFIGAVGGYLVGVQNGLLVGTDIGLSAYTGPTNTMPDTEMIEASPAPSVANSVGVATVSLLESSGELYLKVTTDLSDPVAIFPNNPKRSETFIATEQTDNSYEPEFIEEGDAPQGNWTTVLTRPIVNANADASVLVSNVIFSFKKIPQSRSILFAMSWDLHGGETSGAWAGRISERTLYMYDPTVTSQNVKAIQVFDSFKGEYQYPKIFSLSTDGRYAAIHRFGCWGCGGHTPQTLLLDLKTFNKKEIGRVSFFEWNENGSYDYKDYIVEECKEPSPGECRQDPDTLPLKTGSL